jgi:hypothetical protein
MKKIFGETLRKKLFGLIVCGILSANGAAEESPRDFLIFGNAGRSVSAISLLQRYQDTHEVIGLDGATHWLTEKGIEPKYILGDFDSLSEDGELIGGALAAVRHFEGIPKPGDDEVVFEPYSTGETTFIRAASQNFTDLDKGIKFAIEKKARSVKLINVLGGERTDHTLHNISVLKKFHGQASLHIETDREFLQFLRNEKTVFTGTVGAKFGLFGFPKATATSTGLVWNLDDSYNLELGVQDSSCNVLAEPEVHLEVKGEAFLVRPNY